MKIKLIFLSFGLKSFVFKKDKYAEQKHNIGYLSGTFDTLHYGHINLIKKAKKQCEYLIVGVHPDTSHKESEEYHSFEERFENVRMIADVDLVIPAPKEDDTACKEHSASYLFVGDDYKNTARFKKYEETLKGKTEIIYFPRTKSVSSTQIRYLLRSDS